MNTRDQIEESLKWKLTDIYATEELWEADYAAAQAVQQRDIGVTAQDRLVALSTCAGSETNGRVVVLGRLCPLKEGDEMQ